MKKNLVSVLIFLILFNFIFAIPVRADFEDPSGAIYNDMKDDGTVDANGTEMSVNDTGNSVLGTIVGFLAKYISSPVMLIQALVSVFLESGGIIEAHCTKQDIGLFSIQNIIIGKYLILDADIFRDLTTGIDTSFYASFFDVILDFRETVAMWFIILRDIAIVINLAMLLYIAINMAIATIASDKAKYKELLYNWVLSMAILFLLPYLMTIINRFAEIFVNISRNLMISLEAKNSTSFENEILSSMFTLVTENGGLRMALYAIIYFILVWNEIKFFTVYIKRMLTINFLVVISPLITVTYAADKIADRKAQAFDGWLKEYSVNTFIQPLHCFIYLVFMYMANNIAVKAPIIGIIFLTSLSKAEKIIKSLVAISAKSLRGVGDGMRARGLASSLRKLVPKAGK